MATDMDKRKTYAEGLTAIVYHNYITPGGSTEAGCALAACGILVGMLARAAKADMDKLKAPEAILNGFTLPLAALSTDIATLTGGTPGKTSSLADFVQTARMITGDPVVLLANDYALHETTHKDITALFYQSLRLKNELRISGQDALKAGTTAYRQVIRDVLPVFGPVRTYVLAMESLAAGFVKTPPSFEINPAEILLTYNSSSEIAGKAIYASLVINNTLINKNNPFLSPIRLIGTAGAIIGENVRKQAIKSLGIKELPALSHLAQAEMFLSQTHDFLGRLCAKLGHPKNDKEFPSFDDIMAHALDTASASIYPVLTLPKEYHPSLISPFEAALSRQDVQKVLSNPALKGWQRPSSCAIAAGYALIEHRDTISPVWGSRLAMETATAVALRPPIDLDATIVNLEEPERSFFTDVRQRLTRPAGAALD